jgi:hypothetical protein
MSGSAIDARVNAEPVCADLADVAPVPASAPAALAPSTTSPRPAMTRPLPSAAMPVGRPMQTSGLERLQLFGHRALAETSYQLRRVGGATFAGCAAVAIATIVFINTNLPQGAALTALKSDLARLTPSGNGAVAPGPTGAMLASLPPRTEAPSLVAKILEEAKATGVELPRGQYEFVPARDGVAARYRMTFPVQASYPKIREFMDRTLVALPAVAIEGLRIERKNVGDDSVDAELKLAAFVRSDP